VIVQQLPWCVPVVAPRGAVARTGAPLVVFAASALARKGAYELAAALRGLRVRLRVLGSRSTDAMLWHGIEVEHAGYASDWLAQACVVVLPAHVEHAPRALLRALAAGVPAVATPACGIDATPGLELVPAGDVEALRRAIMDRVMEAH
jgi:glycosyltransferase involved in cell wall biosynthesis